jgi:hypothetical protein
MITYAYARRSGASRRALQSAYAEWRCGTGPLSAVPTSLVLPLQRGFQPLQALQQLFLFTRLHGHVYGPYVGVEGLDGHTSSRGLAGLRQSDRSPPVRRSLWRPCVRQPPLARLPWACLRAEHRHQDALVARALEAVDAASAEDRHSGGSVRTVPPQQRGYSREAPGLWGRVESKKAGAPIGTPA